MKFKEILANKQKTKKTCYSTREDLILLRGFRSILRPDNLR